jgi:tubulin polyglutamylase TTLL1
VHLTNVAVQTGGGNDYNAAHGNKWALADLRLHLEATRGHAATQQLFTDMQQLVVHTLKAVQPVSSQLTIAVRACMHKAAADA